MKTALFCRRNKTPRRSGNTGTLSPQQLARCRRLPDGIGRFFERDMETKTLRLSWPSKKLSKNARGQWSRGFQIGRSVAVAAQRREAWALAVEQKVREFETDTPTLKFYFHPPDRRKRDAQNLPGMLAGAIDGIAQAMGCDDSGFQCVFPRAFGEPVKGGCVIVEISDAS